MSVGDISSTAPGSGARYNTGKPDLSLIPAWITANVALGLYSAPPVSGQPSYRAWQALEMLGRWQQGRQQLGDILLRLDDPLRSAARVFTYGAKKYAAWNWIKGMKWSVPLACAQRHALAMMAGEERDAESGEPHEGHLACNIIMLMQFEQTFNEGNDITYERIMPARVTEAANV